ncbi:hypothetical protein [Bacteroides acidifaciens]|uniref:hypothetical protein n=2 Tax=Bacteroides acidifaciens TaxID=85831 RepID=UPI0030150935
MTIKLYQCIMACLESMKPIGHRRSPYKIVRAWNTLMYYVVNRLENIFITRTSIEMLTKRFSEERNFSQSNVYVTASLTTFPARIKEVRYVIMSILLQTIRPDRVLLWVAEDQFPNRQLPDNLRVLCDYGLEIRFCDDLRSHKKYYYVLQEQKTNELVITFDDDIIYHPHTIERLIKKHDEYPNCIVCSQVHIMTFDERGQLNPYHKWGSAHDNQDIPNKDYMPLTGSGCLYPCGIMPKVTFEKHKIRNIAFTADDLWIGAIAHINGVKICPTAKVARMFSVVGDSQIESLSQVNCIGDGNDVTLGNLQRAFSFPTY